MPLSWFFFLFIYLFFFLNFYFFSFLLLPLLTLPWPVWLGEVVGTSCLGTAEAFADVVDFAVFVQKTQAPFKWMGWCCMSIVLGDVLFFLSDCAINLVGLVLLCCCPSAQHCACCRNGHGECFTFVSLWSALVWPMCLAWGTFVREIRYLPVEDWCLNVPLKVGRSNTGIVHHGWENFFLRSKGSEGHIYYLMVIW